MSLLVCNTIYYLHPEFASSIECVETKHCGRNTRLLCSAPHVVLMSENKFVACQFHVLTRKLIYLHRRRGYWFSLRALIYFRLFVSVRLLVGNLDWPGLCCGLKYTVTIGVFSPSLISDFFSKLQNKVTSKRMSFPNIWALSIDLISVKWD